MAPAADIDRLIEEGLNRYGTGDLDGALLIWEQALAIDPDNAQAHLGVCRMELRRRRFAPAAQAALADIS